MASGTLSELVCECPEQPWHASLHSAISQVAGQPAQTDDGASASRSPQVVPSDTPQRIEQRMVYTNTSQNDNLLHYFYASTGLKWATSA